VIAELRGRLARRAADHVVVDVGGVGYRVFVSLPVLAALPEDGAELDLRIHTQVREDAIHLFGFPTDAERELFRTLIGLSRIGPKAAMQILSGLTAAELARAVASEDVDRLARTPGIGRKTAERLIVELKDRIDVLVAGLEAGRGAGAPPVRDGKLADAIAALEALGVTRARADRALREARQSLGPDASVESWLKAALRDLRPS
jgi:Holliday junction DNA helicase RuvA